MLLPYFDWLPGGAGGGEPGADGEDGTAEGRAAAPPTSATSSSSTQSTQMTSGHSCNIVNRVYLLWLSWGLPIAKDVGGFKKGGNQTPEPMLLVTHYLTYSSMFHVQKAETQIKWLPVVYKIKLVKMLG